MKIRFCCGSIKKGKKKIVIGTIAKKKEDKDDN